jgi:hypothetical protein
MKLVLHGETVWVADPAEPAPVGAAPERPC